MHWAAGNKGGGPMFSDQTVQCIHQHENLKKHGYDQELSARIEDFIPASVACNWRFSNKQ